MNRKIPFLFIIPFLIATSLACSLSGFRNQAQSVEQTAQAIKSDVGGIATVGSSLLNTAQALKTQHPGVLETVQAISTQGAPIVGTLQAVVTAKPGLVQTAQAFVQQEIPTGEPPQDIPIFDREQAGNFFGSSQYIYYTTAAEYGQVLEFYKTQMPNYGWQYLESDSHEYANAAQLNYFKDNRITTINVSANPLNNSTVVVISTGS